LCGIRAGGVAHNKEINTLVGKNAGNLEPAGRLERCNGGENRA
jgi:hypothetical protein